MLFEYLEIEEPMREYMAVSKHGFLEIRVWYPKFLGVVGGFDQLQEKA